MRGAIGARRGQPKRPIQLHDKKIILLDISVKNEYYKKIR